MAKVKQAATTEAGTKTRSRAPKNPYQLSGLVWMAFDSEGRPFEETVSRINEDCLSKLTSKCGVSTLDIAIRGYSVRLVRVQPVPCTDEEFKELVNGLEAGAPLVPPKATEGKANMEPSNSGSDPK